MSGARGVGGNGLQYIFHTVVIKLLDSREWRGRDCCFPHIKTLLVLVIYPSPIVLRLCRPPNLSLELVVACLLSISCNLVLILQGDN